MRDLGSIQSPQHAFYLNLGLESLHVRMPRHVENGQAVAEFLANHPKVVSVTYSGLRETNTMNWHRNICRRVVVVSYPLNWKAAVQQQKHL